MKQYVIFLSLMLVLGACIKDDIPYPYIQANILSISAAGESAPASIDSTNLTVTFRFPESADIYNVKIDSYSLTPGAVVSKGDLDAPIDLSSDYVVEVSLYQDYAWTLRGVRNIERYFTLENQVGTSAIDVGARTVSASVSKQVALPDVRVLTCKLGPSSATVSPDLAGATVDFSNPVTVTVDDYGHKEEWTVTVTQADMPVETVSADGWTCVGWVYGVAEAGKHNYVEYRVKGDTGWVPVPDGWISHDGGDFRARISGLTPSTTYEARAVSDSDYGNVVEFSTGTAEQMPNSDFDNWWLDGKVWCPWAEGATPFWGTGNKGATTIGQSNSVPTDDTVDGSGKAAMLQTKFVGIGPLGKLAAGNIFAGDYVRTDGTNGVLAFGREFSMRPTRLKGYLKYTTAPISSASGEFADLKGRPDTCVVWIALVDLDSQLEIRTNPSDRSLFDPEADYVIAYGCVEYGYDIDEYMPFEITLDYRSTSRVPRYIMCTGSASKYGDYFTGGDGAVLYLDDLWLEYDY